MTATRSNTSVDLPELSPATAIVCRDIDVVFGFGKTSQRVLDQLQLNVPRGEILSLLGPSGCGKSTLLRVIAGLTTPTAGSVTIDGLPVDQARRQLAFVFQESALLPWRSVWQNVALPYEIRKEISSKELKDRMAKTLELVGFKPNDWRKKPSQLSGGMKMRASIARALITEPRILLLDEPFAALDDMLRSKLNDLMLRIVVQTGCTMLFVTHNISEAIYLSHSIAVFHRGRIAETLRVGLPLPRRSDVRSSPQFAAEYGRVSAVLTRGEST